MFDGFGLQGMRLYVDFYVDFGNSPFLGGSKCGDVWTITRWWFHPYLGLDVAGK